MKYSQESNSESKLRRMIFVYPLIPRNYYSAPKTRVTSPLTPITKGADFGILKQSKEFFLAMF